MQHRKQLRLVLLGGLALACALVALGGNVLAQQATFVPLEPPPTEHASNTGKYAPLEWTPGTEHPGQKIFVNTCAACHQLTDRQTIGPGLLGLAERVPERSRLLKFINNPKDTDDDPYFVEIRKKFADAMLPQGNTAGGTHTESELLAVIDFIFRNKAEYGPPPEERILQGRKLVSGEKRFENGAPSCRSCHTIGADKNLRGGNVAQNIAHTWVIAKDAEGLKELMENPDGPAMHHFYRAKKSPLTDEEYAILNTFFERAARDTGTESSSNYLPIFALILAALGIFILDGSLFGKLFVQEDHEYVDGPYAEDDHGHH